MPPEAHNFPGLNLIQLSSALEECEWKDEVPCAPFRAHSVSGLGLGGEFFRFVLLHGRTFLDYFLKDFNRTNFIANLKISPR